MRHLLRLVFLGLSVTAFCPQIMLGQSNILLRVMASNLTSGNGQKYDTPGLNILKGLKPDIVAMQEFNYNNNTTADFDALVANTFGPGFSYFRENNTLPNGIISRYPIVAAGSWADAEVSNRGFVWAHILLPGDNHIYVVSVHLLTSSATSRLAEAQALTNRIQTDFPAGASVILAGDFNTSSRTEAAVDTLTTILSDHPVPADSNGDQDTNAGRNNPYDYVLPSFSLTNKLTTVSFPSHSYPNGLVFDSRVYTNGPTDLDDFAPVTLGDSGAVNMQHMGVVKDFLIVTNGAGSPPSILAQPQSQSVQQNSNATFTVSATGTATLTYQWRLAATNLPGATGTSFTVTNAQPDDAGAYSVAITNDIGFIISSNAVLTVSSLPLIQNPPQSQTIVVGQDVTFNVDATGPGPLSYQWRFSGTNIPNATTSAYTRSSAQVSDAGTYAVVITNFAGSVTGSATLTVLTVPSTTIAQWDFNSTPPDASTTTGTLAPSTGSGTASLVGGTTTAFATGSTTDPANSGNDNTGWNSSSYPAQGIGNKTAGVRFNVSTAGRQNIGIRWDQRASNTGSKYARLQYSTNGTTFVDFPTAVSLSTANTFEPKTNSLAAFAGVNNNPNFAFRIVSEYESSAINTVNSNYVGVAGTYGTGGTVRFDMVTVSGSVISSSNPPAIAATLGSPALNGSQQFQFTVTGTAGSNYIVQAAADLMLSNWVSLLTNASPFTFVETNGNNFLRRFYRAIVAP